MSESQLPEPPDQARQGRTYRFGRYRRPIPRPLLRVPGTFGRFRLKEWSFMSVTTDRWFLGFALVQLGYLGNAFCYLVDRRRPDRPLEYEAITPLGAGLRISPSSVAGRSRFDWRGGRFDIRWTGAWEVQLDVPVRGAGGTERLHGAFRMEAEDALALLHPLKPRRPAYTHKAAGMPVDGLLALGAKEIHLGGGLGAIDWTRSMALRDTRWKWASLSTRLDDGRRIGLNLSAEVYDDAEGNSRENALWIDGRVIPLAGVDFHLPLEPAREPWRVVSRNGDALDLRFHPSGARAQRLDLKLVRSDFIQAFGTWEGRIAPRGEEPVALDGAFGVAEEHYARW